MLRGLLSFSLCLVLASGANAQKFSFSVKSSLFASYKLGQTSYFILTNEYGSYSDRPSPGFDIAINAFKPFKHGSYGVGVGYSSMTLRSTKIRYPYIPPDRGFVGTAAHTDWRREIWRYVQLPLWATIELRGKWKLYGAITPSFLFDFKQVFYSTRGTRPAPFTRSKTVSHPSHGPVMYRYNLFSSLGVQRSINKELDAGFILGLSSFNVRNPNSKNRIYRHVTAGIGLTYKILRDES